MLRRTAHGLKVLAKRVAFNFQEFRKLRNLEDIRRYADERLQHMGGGDTGQAQSSRITYRFGSGKVLKIAMSEKGRDQNRAEVKIWTAVKHEETPLVVPVIFADPTFGWIISEIVKPFGDQDGVEIVKRLDMDQYAEDIEELIDYVDQPHYIPKEYLAVRDEPVYKQLSKIIHQLKLLPGDLQFPGHYGLTASGRTVILDSGFTEEVWKRHKRPDEF